MLRLMNKDKKVLTSYHTETLVRDMVFVCMHDDIPVGILALGTCDKSPVKIKKEVCVKHFGRLIGSIAAWQYKAVMEKPKVTEKTDGHIEFIATDPELRGRGIGSAMIRYLQDNLDYEYYYLEVLSKNPRARALYERLGFVKVRDNRNFWSSLFGFGTPEFMRLEKVKTNR
jgi:ribosomal protein S18 acetylase RimI-like enzyme